MQQIFTISAGPSLETLVMAEKLQQQILKQFPHLTINLLLNNDNLIIPDFTIGEITEDSYVNEENKTVTGFIEKGDCRNIALFNNEVNDKLKTGLPVIIHSVIHNNEMVKKFLKKGLPKLSEMPATIEILAAKGDSFSLLQSLDEKKVDGIILSAASVNALLQSTLTREKINLLYTGKKLMVLPLFDCPPVPGQGIITATANSGNEGAVAILKHLHNNDIEAFLKNKWQWKGTKKDAVEYGAFYIETPTTFFTYAAGISANGQSITEWDFTIALDTKDKILFSSTDYMKDFFSYQFLEDSHIAQKIKAVFISSHKAIHNAALENEIQSKKVWAAGTRTWYQLAKKGIWVQGCADGLGLEFIQPLLAGPLINIDKNNLEIITNTLSVGHWKTDGWKASATYKLIPGLPLQMQETISKADIIFWTSFQQYELCKPFLKEQVYHLCPAGKTAKLLLALDLDPIIFPTIKAFTDWREQQ